MDALCSSENTLEYNCFMSSKTKPPSGWNCLEYIIKQKHTSLNHTTGLNRALDYLDGDYVVCTDADISVLTPNWDLKMIAHMKENDLSILGSGFWNVTGRYTGFPTVTFFIAKSEHHLKVNPDLRPTLEVYPNKWGWGAAKQEIKNDEESSIFGIPIGSIMQMDSGWRLPAAYKKNGFKGEVFEDFEQYGVGNHIPQVWSLNGEPIVCHKGKSSKRRQSHAVKFTRSAASYIHKKHGIKISR